MLNLQKVKSKLTAQGADPATLGECITALQAANMLPSSQDTALSGKEVAALLIGATAPDPAKAAHHVLTYGGLQGELGLFALSLQYLLEAIPANITATSVRICQSFPMARIEYADGDTHEFTDTSFIGRGFRSEVVFSGGLICDLAFRLRNDNSSGWRGEDFQKEIEAVAEACHGHEDGN